MRRSRTFVDPSLRILKYYLDELMYAASVEGEANLYHRIFSH
jgi:hypothetical protein